jgi:hypothetical protein
MAEKGRSVSLEGDALGSMRLSSATAQSHLIAIVDRMNKMLDQKKKVRAITVIFNKASEDPEPQTKPWLSEASNTKVLVLDEDFNLVGVYEDPPGICRDPSQAELDDWG